MTKSNFFSVFLKKVADIIFFSQSAPVFAGLHTRKISTAGYRSTPLICIKTYILIVYYNYYCLNMVILYTKYRIKSNFFSVFFIFFEKKLRILYFFGGQHRFLFGSICPDCRVLVGDRIPVTCFETYILIFIYNCFCLNMVILYIKCRIKSNLFFVFFILSESRRARRTRILRGVL